MTIAITNTVLSNGGDAAIALGMVRSIEAAMDEKIEYVVFDSQPTLIANRFPEFAIRPSAYNQAWSHNASGLVQRIMRRLKWSVMPSWMRRAADRIAAGGPQNGEPLNELAQADMIISTGGTYLVEQYWLGPRLLEFDLLERLGSTYLLFTQSLGPFTKPKVRRQMKGVLSNAALTMVRDPRSQKHALDVAPKANVEIRADAAFALADPHALEDAKGRAIDRSKRMRVGISVREWSHFSGQSAEAGMAAYRAAIGGLVEHLIEKHDADIRFVSTCQGLPSYRYDDSKVADAILSELPQAAQERVSVCTEYLRPEQVMEEVAACDIVVATRMHMAILSLCAGTPVLPIAYEFKTNEVFSRLNMSGHVQDIDSITSEKLIDGFRNLIDTLPQIRNELFNRVEAERQDAMASGMRVKEVFEALGA